MAPGLDKFDVLLEIVLSLVRVAGKELTSCFSDCAVFLYAVLIVCVPFPYGVWGRKKNSIVSVPDHCLFIYFVVVHNTKVIQSV